MRRVLRDKRTGRYYQAGGQWTAHQKHALEFKDNESAIDCGRTLNSSSLELVLRFTGYGRDIAFPLTRAKNSARVGNSQRSSAPRFQTRNKRTPPRRGPVSTA